MKYEEFACNIQAEVQKKMGKEVQTDIRKITKNNGLVLTGISISENSQKVSPMIYLEELYEKYKKGMTVLEAADHVIEIYEKSKLYTPISADFYKDFDNIRERVVCKLINYDKNIEQIQEMPHVKCMDLAVVFYYMLEHDEIGNGTIMIYNSHLSMWNITENQLYQIARKNTYRLLPWECQNMKEILEESLQQINEDLRDNIRQELYENPGADMYVLSNTMRYLGAIHILYDCTLSKIAEDLKGSFYVLPSSIHECIIVPYQEDMDAKELLNMVIEVNQTQVLPEEVLSDNLYFYEKEDHRLSIFFEGNEYDGRKN